MTTAQRIVAGLGLASVAAHGYALAGLLAGAWTPLPLLWIVLLHLSVFASVGLGLRSALVSTRGLDEEARLDRIYGSVVRARGLTVYVFVVILALTLFRSQLGVLPASAELATFSAGWLFFHYAAWRLLKV